MGKYRNPLFMHKTNSVAGFVETDIEPIKFKKFNYVRRKTANGTVYYGKDGEWTDIAHAMIFSQKDAIKIVNSLRGQYSVEVFSTTKQC